MPTRLFVSLGNITGEVLEKYRIFPFILYHALVRYPRSKISISSSVQANGKVWDPDVTADKANSQ